MSCDQLSVENVSHRHGGRSLILKKHVHYVAYETDLHFFTVTAEANIIPLPSLPIKVYHQAQRVVRCFTFLARQPQLV